MAAGSRRASKSPTSSSDLLLCSCLQRGSGKNIEARRSSISSRYALLTTVLNPKGVIFFLLIPSATAHKKAFYLAIFTFLVPLIGMTWTFVGVLAGSMIAPRYLQVVPRMLSVVLATFAGVLIAKTLRCI